MTYKYIDGMVIPIPDLPDSTTSSKGILQLTSDLSGTATSPLVAKLQGNPIKNQGSLSSLQDGYVATWVNGDGYIEFIHNSVSSGSVVPGSAGQFFITNSTPASAWTSLVSLELTHGRFTAGGGGTDHKTIIGPLVGSETGNSALWLLPSATAPTVSNYTMQGDWLNGLAFNVPSGGTFSFYANGSQLLANVNVNGFSAIAGANWQWAATATSPVISQAISTTGAGQTMSVMAQDAKVGSAATGGNLQLLYGTRDGAGSPAQVIVGNSTLTDMEVRFGYPTNPTGFGAIYILPHATASVSTNYAFLADGTSTYFNAPGAGTLQFRIANVTKMSMAATLLTLDFPYVGFDSLQTSPQIYQIASSSAAGQPLTFHAQDTSFLNANGGNLNLYSGAGNGTGVPGAIVLGIAGSLANGVNIAGTSTCDFTFGTAVATAHFGTNLNAAHLILRGGNAVTIMDGYAPSNVAGTGNLSIIGSIQHTITTPGATPYTIDGITTDKIIRLTGLTASTQSVILPAPTVGRILEFWIDLTGGGAVDCIITFARHTSEAINGTAANLIVGPYTAGSISKLLCRSDGTNWFISG